MKQVWHKVVSWVFEIHVSSAFAMQSFSNCVCFALERKQFDTSFITTCAWLTVGTDTACDALRLRQWEVQWKKYANGAYCRNVADAPTRSLAIALTPSYPWLTQMDKSKPNEVTVQRRMRRWPIRWAVSSLSAVVSRFDIRKNIKIGYRVFVALPHSFVVLKYITNYNCQLFLFVTVSCLICNEWRKVGSRDPSNNSRNY